VTERERERERGGRREKERRGLSFISQFANDRMIIIHDILSLTYSIFIKEAQSDQRQNTHPPPTHTHTYVLRCICRMLTETSLT